MRTLSLLASALLCALQAALSDMSPAQLVIQQEFQTFVIKPANHEQIMQIVIFASMFVGAVWFFIRNIKPFLVLFAEVQWHHPCGLAFLVGHNSFCLLSCLGPAQSCYSAPQSAALQDEHLLVWDATEVLERSRDSKLTQEVMWYMLCRSASALPNC